MKKKFLLLLVAALVAVPTAGCTKQETAKEETTNNVSLGEYKGISVEKVEPEDVTDDEVEEVYAGAVDAFKETKENKKKKAEEGDVVNIDYKGTIKGKEFEGGTAENQELVLGSNSYIEGFEASIVGHKPGDTFTFHGKFPKEYGVEELNGKDVDFEITLNFVLEYEEKELTDKMVSEYTNGECKKVKDYKDFIRKNLKEEKKETAENQFAENAWAEVLKKSEVRKYDEDTLEKYKENIKRSIEESAALYGMDFEAYMKQAYGYTEKEDIDAALTDSAKYSYKALSVAKEILRREKIEVTDDVAKEFVKENYNMQSLKDYQKQVAVSLGCEDLKDYVKKNGKGSDDEIIEDLKDEVTYSKAKEFVGENAVVKEAKEPTEKTDTKEEK